MESSDVALWRSLQHLRSAACWLMTGAHPDDEWNAFLGWLAFGLGVHTVYACSTRGEGGQNALGPERGRALAALRSREMELAAAEIDLTLRWIGAGPAHGTDDPIFDFGFSKSGDDTLRRWGEARLLERLVQLIRSERPDAISPTFLDVPGQHGHHRAMTRCTLRAAELAAHPGFVIPDTGLPPWRVAKVYLPAFSGAGGSYDDREPPPHETARVDLGEQCAALGASWAQLGERSRRHHASQGMGRDLPDGPRPFPLHLVSGPPDRNVPMDGVAHRLADLAGLLPDVSAARALREADTAIEMALAEFPARARVADALHLALAALATVDLPAGAEHIAHRLALKRRQLGHASAQALGIAATIAVAPDTLRAGGSARISLAVYGPATARLRLPQAWHAEGPAFEVPAGAPPFGTLRDGFDPLGGDDVIGATLAWTHAGSGATLEIGPADRLCLAPAIEASLTPSRVVRRTASDTPVTLVLTGAVPPPSWPVLRQNGERIDIFVAAGRHDLLPAGARLSRFDAPHAGRVALVEPAAGSLLRAPIAIDPGARVGIVAGEVDATLGWLRQLDIAAEAVDDATLAGGDLSRFTTLLIGIFAFGQRPALRAHRDRLIAWTEAGGSLVTLYHRPGDGWDAGRIPPRHLLVGSPSFRWRVTDPTAAVTPLHPGHPLLTTPNPIGTADWDGWVRERGLYFASAWDEAYLPLLAIADPDEAPLHGALLAAPIGQGRHVHVALALHHQLTALVPGAFRLLANLVARPTELSEPV
jgi:LmbE family N-acetylglucosaminyl deacetylase